MNTKPAKAAARAFTLIEVALALAIAAVVLTAINTVFFGALHLRAETMKVTENTMPIDHALEVLKRDLVAIVPPATNGLAGVMGTDATPVGMTQPLILEFYTSSGVISDDAPWGDTQKIDYWLQDPTNRNSGAVGKDLIRGVTRNLLASTPEPPEPHKVIGDIDSMRISFFDGTNWNDTWSVTLSNVPVAMKVFLKFAAPRGGQPVNPPIQFLVPVIMSPSTSTNQD